MSVNNKTKKRVFHGGCVLTTLVSMSMATTNDGTMYVLDPFKAIIYTVLFALWLGLWYLLWVHCDNEETVETSIDLENHWLKEQKQKGEQNN